MRKFAWSAAAIFAVTLFWVSMRLMSPILAYYPPEAFEQALSPSAFVQHGVSEFALVSYLCITLILLFLVFASIQKGLAGRRGTKGLVFGTMLGVLWALAFLSAVEFHGTALRAELINGIVDLPPLALAGWFAGLLWGTDGERQATPVSRHALAIPVVAIAFSAGHSATLLFVDDPLSVMGRMMFIPARPVAYIALAAIGAWIGFMYVVLRGALTFKSAWANAALFSIVIFGHSWFWFNMFFNILYADVLWWLVAMWMAGIAGVFFGVVAYEQVRRRDVATVANASG